MRYYLIARYLEQYRQSCVMSKLEDQAIRGLIKQLGKMQSTTPPIPKEVEAIKVEYKSLPRFEGRYAFDLFLPDELAR